jgi:TPR repeat protein
MHLTGQGAEVDHKQAFSYFKQAVETGSQWSGLADALFFLGKRVFLRLAFFRG